MAGVLFRGLAVACLACSIITCKAATSPASGSKLLVLLQDSNVQSQHSKYFQALEEAGIHIDFRNYKEAGLKLRDYDTWLYDHLAIFAPAAESFGGSIDQQAILDFIDSGHNVVIAGSSKVSDTVRNLAAEVGVDLDDRGTAVYDHFSHSQAAGGSSDHTLVVSQHVVTSPAIFGGEVKAPVLFRGVAASVPADSELVTVAVSAPLTSYSHDPRKSMAEPPQLMAGQGITLLALVQARNNARVLVTGSMAMFSDELFDAHVTLAATGTKLGKSGNEQVMVGASLWAFQQRGVLRTSSLRHRLRDAAAGAPAPMGYRINDEVEVSVDIMEVTAGQEKPYQADDVQIEFVMLDPYVRLPLKALGNGTYSLQFKVPDVYGVFKYRLDYRHLGYSYIDLTMQVPVRPYKHNEYERFLVCAYPYYASALSSMLAFFALGFFYLYNK